jgi:thiamine biosynthesis lipoprotein
MITTSEFPVWGGMTRVAVTDPAGLTAAVGAVEQTIAAFDDACSSFREDSELARLNAADGASVGVGPVLLAAVEAALRAARITSGAVDPTVGAALIAHGFTPSPGRDTPAAGRVTIAAVPGYETVVVDPAAATIRLGRGVRLDLGATAKALAADQAAAAAHAAAGCGVLVSLSGDLAIAGESPAEGWSIRVTDDHRSGPEAPGQTIVLHSGGLATSSTTVRATGESHHHVIDPATGRPAPVHFRTVSVAAATCLDANIATTAAIVRGEPAAGWLADQQLPSRLVRADGTVLHLAGWPIDADDLGVAREPVREPA